jgi:hypothetical protein
MPAPSPTERARRVVGALDEALLAVTAHAIVIVDPGGDVSVAFAVMTLPAPN